MLKHQIICGFATLCVFGVSGQTAYAATQTFPLKILGITIGAAEISTYPEAQRMGRDILVHCQIQASLKVVGQTVARERATLFTLRLPDNATRRVKNRNMGKHFNFGAVIARSGEAVEIDVYGNVELKRRTFRIALLREKVTLAR